MGKIKYLKVGRNDCDSLPLGNGDIGINIWPEEGNKFSMFISKTDSFSSALELLKIGKLSFFIECDEELLFESYSLDMENAVCKIKYNLATITVFVDFNNPCIRVRVKSKIKVKIKIDNEIWRKEEKYIKDDRYNRGIEYGRTVGQDNITEKIITYPDIVDKDYDDCIMWYHQNPDSHYEPNLKHQNLLHIKHLFDDPLKYRTFGACVMSEKEDNGKLHNITIGVLTKIIKSKKHFKEELYKLTKKCKKDNYKEVFKKHKEDFSAEFNKSYIEIDGDEKAKLVNSGYQIQRYMNLCAGKGDYPIKFNGSIFTFTIPNKGITFDPDYRMWGGCYWFQNTRLIYWSMLNAGDFTYMKPLFDMYDKAYEFVKAKTKDYYGFEGLLYPETMTPWGTHRNVDYGFDREGVKNGEACNVYLRFYHSGMLELVTIMLEYYKHTKDEEFKQQILLKHASGVLDFYFNRYNELDEDGKIIIYPSQALENWQDALNPTDAVAGLHYVLDELLKVDFDNDEMKSKLLDYKLKTPEIAMFRSGGKPDLLARAMIKPAKEYDAVGNVENPELYAVFPYRMVSFENDVGIGRETFRRRSIRNYFGWTQDGIQSAVLAMPETSREFVEAKFTTWNDNARFQGFWGPNFDWVPDQDHGSSASIALQKMLIQCVDEKIYLFPAWPKEWNVKFKLFAYDNTIIEGEYKDGKVLEVKAFPEKRIDDIVYCFDYHLDNW